MIKRIDQSHKVNMCNKCYSFYYKKSWHQNKPDFMDEESDEVVPVRFTKCHACLEQDNAFDERDTELLWG